MDLKDEVREILISRTQSLRGIAEKYEVSLPTLKKIKDGDKVSDKTLIYIKSVLS